VLKNKIDKATSFIKDITERTNKDLLLGLSGGIDSAVALALAIKAVGPKRIKVVMLPYKENSNLLDAVALANSYGVEFEIISIADIVEAFNCSDEYRKANMMARVRMTVLYDQAMKNNALVVGTTNLSEYYLGYFTKWGDGAVDLEPLMSMTKTEVFEIAKLLGLPSIFLSKKPSADLWEGQTDEDEMGLKYSEVDKIIDQYYEQFDSMNYVERFEDFLQLKIDNTSAFYKDKHDTLTGMRKRYLNSLHKINPIPSNLREL
jgi:NAD+ synthase